MYDRGIFKKQVQRTLRRPDRTFIQGQSQIAEYTTSSKAVIRVIYLFIPGASGPFVVSAVRLGKLSKANQRAEIGTHHDSALDIAYIALVNGEIAETMEAGNGIYCDLDGFGEIIGMEMFDYSCHEGLGKAQRTQ